MKLKTRKSVLKRFKIKKTFVSHKKAFKSHLLGCKSSRRLRNLRNTEKIHPSDMDTIKKSIIS